MKFKLLFYSFFLPPNSSFFFDFVNALLIQVKGLDRFIFRGGDCKGSSLPVRRFGGALEVDAPEEKILASRICTCSCIAFIMASILASILASLFARMSAIYLLFHHLLYMFFSFFKLYKTKVSYMK